MKKFLFCLVLLWGLPAGAHDLWMERDDTGVTLYYGHKYAAHAGSSLVEYKPEIVIRADCYTVDGDTAAHEVTDRYPVHISPPAAVSCILVSTGYWTKTPYGTRNLPKSKTTYPLKSWLSYESVKRIDDWSDALARPLSMKLDIVPLNNPLTMHPGDKIRLLVTFEGEPIEGAIVSYAGTPRGSTGASGTINIRLKRQGLQIIQASHSIPIETGEADTIIYTANLNFEIEEDS